MSVPGLRINETEGRERVHVQCFFQQRLYTPTRADYTGDIGIQCAEKWKKASAICAC